jgi:hypothetical protein
MLEIVILLYDGELLNVLTQINMFPIDKTIDIIYLNVKPINYLQNVTNVKFILPFSPNVEDGASLRIMPLMGGLVENQNILTFDPKFPDTTFGNENFTISNSNTKPNLIYVKQLAR